ncbi:helix-turn-helix transcriptional regulator [Pseudomonas sp. 15A4]|jgi:DNA-binding HxlR family transcriptional regulator|uniref:winged helix-turn-helix transcriptional regulator n=1 Tax=Pseudomonas TaxID=286 RepID=UPI000F0377F0|nr:MULTISPECIES: helix-turn-helix domain-containing protein [Pseudomonas]MDC6383129.1 helix-turn-helix domain-containing protein [Pseudomonas graminis]QSB18057.1 helix-turn-helix transcriptional regulator [Pseudomonas sp. 15A4]
MNDSAIPAAGSVSLLERIRTGEVLARDCPSREILNHVCSRWGVLVLVVLLDGMHRFSELRRKIGGVSEKMLSQTLQSLEQDGFVDRKALPVVPPHVEYRLTPMGEEVALQMDGLTTWIEENLPRILAAREGRAAVVE